MHRRSLSVVAVVGTAVAVLIGVVGQPGATGQDKPKPGPLVVIPGAKEITEIRVIGNELFPAGPIDPKKKFDLKLTKEGQFKPVLDWLTAIDWDSSKAEDIAQLRVVAELSLVGQLVITKKDKTSQRFELQSDFIIEGNHRWKTDVKKLDAAIKQAR
jgi:hypothetical protein